MSFSYQYVPKGEIFEQMGRKKRRNTREAQRPSYQDRHVGNDEEFSLSEVEGARS